MAGRRNRLDTGGVYERDAETLQDAFEALVESGVEAMLAYVADDFEMITPAGLAAEPDTYRGHEGVRRWWSSFEEIMDGVRVELTDVEPTGTDGVLLTSLRLSARGRATGIELTQEATARCAIADSRVVSLSFFASRDEARAAGP